MQVVRFSDTRTASHRSCSLGKAAGFKSAHVWGFDQLRFWKKRTAKTTTITSTAISTQFVSVTPRPPTSIADHAEN